MIETGSELTVPDDDDLPGEWHDVSDESGHRYHWNRGDGYPSIRASRGGLGGSPGWEVEMYPNPEDDKEESILRTVHDTADNAADRVLELMEEHDA